MSTPPEPARPAPAGLPPSGRYAIDPAHSAATFRAKAFGLLWVNGHLPVAHGHITITGTAVEGSGELAADGVDTGVRARDWHLRSSHYLHTSEHPCIQVELDGGDVTDPEPSCAVTVRGRTQQVPMTLRRLELDDGALRVGLSAALDRTVFPMLPPPAGVSRVVHLEVDLAATPA